MINQNSFKQSIEINCQATTSSAAFEVDGASLPLNKGTLTGNALTLTYNENTSLECGHYDDVQPENCNSPEPEGTWESFNAKRSTPNSNQYRTRYDREVIPCFQKDKERI